MKLASKKNLDLALTKDEAAIIASYRALTLSGQQTISRFVKREAADQIEQDRTSRFVPRLIAGNNVYALRKGVRA